jgi:16S rRNA (cytosine1402-N4)-methyltransferase
MLNEVLEYLEPKKGGYFIDGTLGGGGYTEALANAVGKKGKVLAIDLDKSAIENFAKKKLKNVILSNHNFCNLEKIVAEEFESEILFDGIVLDLGLSSFQLDDSRRGFSFREDTPLDMAMNSEGESKKTKEIVNKYKETDLARIIFEYGE